MNVQEPSGRLMSVVIPVLNGESVITHCLNSLLFQRHRPDEIIVVDNGSTDETIPRVKQWVLAHPEIPLQLVTETKKGPSAARNRGGRMAKGEVLAFLDADCEAPPDWLETIDRRLDEGLQAVGGPYVAHPSASVIEKYAAASWPSGETDLQHSLSNPFTSQFLLGGNLALLRRAWEKGGGFDESLHTGEDWDLSLRLKKEGMSLQYRPDLGVIHHVQSSLLKRIRRAFSHGLLQSKIVKRDFRKFLTISMLRTSWRCPSPVTIAIEPISLAKIILALVGVGRFYPFWAVAFFLGLLLMWEGKMLRRLLSAEVSFAFFDLLTVPLDWAFARLATELGRWVGSVRHNVLCG
ncbi:MAG: glycosyltransferase [Candidatus Omnitrophica bacterium]|nr:glycosyltransferase [Candidatus Omnitrophota bacterium]